MGIKKNIRAKLKKYLNERVECGNPYIFSEVVKFLEKDRKNIIKQIDSITEWLDVSPDAGDIETAIEELNVLKESLMNPKNKNNAEI